MNDAKVDTPRRRSKRVLEKDSVVETENGYVQKPSPLPQRTEISLDHSLELSTIKSPARQSMRSPVSPTKRSPLDPRDFNSSSSDEESALHSLLHRSERLKQLRQNRQLQLENQLDGAHSFIDGQSQKLNRLHLSLRTLKSTVNLELQQLQHEMDILKEQQIAYEDYRKGHNLAIKARKFSSTMQSTYGNGKVFSMRDSRLSELLKIKDFDTVYNIFVAILPLLGIGLLAQNYAETGKAIDFSLLTFAFGKLDVVFLGWLGLFSFSLVGYWFKFANLWLGKVYGMWLQHCVYALFQIVLLMFASAWTLTNKLPPASGLIIMCEQIRLAMKLHSFYRAHMDGYDATLPKSAEETEKKNAGFSQYLYFLFSPTLLYRANYPRSPVVRWTNVFIHLTECSIIVLYLYILFSRYLIPIVNLPPDYNESVSGFLMGLFNSMLPGMVVFVFGFFGFLHCWLNFWAELLQFGDREFYRDWWNSQSFPEYYRKWNGVVYDWIYTYLYVDLVSCLESYKFKPSFAKALASLFVIQFSAIVHEYILACAFGYWFPVLWAMYGGPGLFFSYLKTTKMTKNNNIFVWIMLLIGTGLMIVAYSREYYVRKQFVDPDLTVTESEYWKQFTTSYSLSKIIDIFYQDS